MDNDSPASRVERSFWTVWYYITGAVNRFFRPDPANIVSNDPKPLQESTAGSEPDECGHAEGDSSGEGVNEEHPLATTSLISSSRPVVAWEPCTAEIDLGPDEEGVQHKTQLGRSSENTASEEGESTREEQSAQTGSGDTWPLVDKDTIKDEEEERGQKLCAHGRNEMPESDEYEEDLNTSSQRFAGDAMSEDMEESGRKASAEDKTQRATTPADLKDMDETATKIQVAEEDNEMRCEDKQDLVTADTEVKLCTITDLSLGEEEKVTEDERVQRDEADKAEIHEEVENSEGVLLLVEEARQVENQLSAVEELSGDNRDLKGDQDFASLHELQVSHNKPGSVFEDEPVVVGQEHVMAHGNESDNDEDVKEQEHERTPDEKEEDGNEATNNQTTDEELQQEEDTKEVSEDSQEDGETDDVETESTVIDEKYNVMITHISGDEAEEERLSGEEGSEEGYMEVAYTATSVTVKPQGETGQEISGEFKNVSRGTCEGRLVVSLELNSPTCEETQEGVPEYNNEPGEPAENTTQRFLEVGDCEEIPTTQLPEEVENEDPESLQNSGSSTGADYLFVRERMEEEQHSTEDIKNSLLVEEHAGIEHLTGSSQETERPLAPVIEEAEFLFKEEEGKLLCDSMKTGFEDTEKEFETHAALADKADEAAKATKEEQDETQELLDEYEKDEELCDSKEADAAGDSREAIGDEAEEVPKMTETSFLQELEDTIQSEQNSNRTPNLVENISEFGFMKQLVETEPTLLEKGSVEMQDAGIDMEETGFGVEEEAETEMELGNLPAVGVAAELTPEKNEKESTWIAELSESLKTETLLSDEVLETNNEEMFTETEAADGSMTAESRPEHLTVMSPEETTKHVTELEGSNDEETAGSISGHQDVIDEDILDWWIQTALSEDADGMKQQEGLEQIMDTEIESSSEEQHDLSAVQTEKDEEQTVEANSGGSEVVTDTEMTSSAAESGFSDQSLSEWGTQNSEVSTESLQGIYDIAADMSESADIDEVSKQQSNSGFQDALMEKTAEMAESYLKEDELITETGFPPYSGVATSEAIHLEQESDRSQEKTEKDTGSQLTDLARKSDREGAEKADVDSVAEMSASFTVEETEVEEEPFEITAPESGRSRSGSEVSSEGQSASTSDSQGDTCTESERRSPSLDKPQPGWSEDIAQSLARPNGAEVAEQLAATSEIEMEVDSSGLDFTAQRSRIAVKNPLVRPPKDPRSLLHMPSLDPTPSKQTPAKVPAGVPLGGLGIGIKLPGLGAGFPVLRKTPRAVREENSQETASQYQQEPETEPEEKSDTPKQDEAQHKPKWMPPRHPGFGNPLMSELKTKLKKTTKE